MAKKAKSAHVIAFANRKGGGGKTSGAVNVAAELAHRNFRVLLVDLDSQGDATTHLGHEKVDLTVGHVLLGQAPILAAIIGATSARPRLDLLPASAALAIQQRELYERPDFEQLLARALDSVQQLYDYIILDCPAVMETLTQMAFCAADRYVIACMPSRFYFDKLEEVTLMANWVVSNGFNPRLRLGGIFFTKYNPNIRGRSKHAIVELTRATYGEQSVLPNIRDNIAVEDAQVFRQTVLEYDPTCAGAQDFARLTTALLTQANK